MKIRSLTIALDCQNAAFGGDGKEEIARILKTLAWRLSNGHEPTLLRDANGNSVGTVAYVEDETSEVEY